MTQDIFNYYLHSGIVIPILNEFSEITNLLVRLDKPYMEDGKLYKYVWVSSLNKGGVSSGVSLHVPQFDFSKSCNPDFLGITEGPLKGDFATLRTNKLYIAVPGVNCWRYALSYIDNAKPKKIGIAFDVDFISNLSVARALKNFFEELIKRGFHPQLQLWNKGKGIDDALLLGQRIQTLCMKDSLCLIEENFKNNNWN